MSCRNICFTINNPTEEDVHWCEQVVCSYICYGRERGESGTPHIQGYIEFEVPKRFTTLKRECPRGHFEKRMGTASQASTYCQKDGDYVERGNISQQGKRSDLDGVVADVVERLPMKEIAEAHPAVYVKYHRGLERLQWRLAGDRVEPPRVVWLWGPAGCGKTREAVNCESVYIKDGSPWWDGYEFQHRIVIDDFDKRSWVWRDLLRVLDRYPYQGQVKGGYIKITSPEIYITCEFAPASLWDGNDRAQILRRIAEVRDLTPVPL